MYAGMLIYIHSGVRIFPLVVEVSDTIETVKDRIKTLSRTPPKNQRLFYAGEYLRDGLTLSDYCICHGASIHLVYGTTCHHIRLIGMLLIRSMYILCIYIFLLLSLIYVCGPAWIT